jgi:hypothetical protein
MFDSICYILSHHLYNIWIEKIGKAGQLFSCQSRKCGANTLSREFFTESRQAIQLLLSTPLGVRLTGEVYAQLLQKGRAWRIPLARAWIYWPRSRIEAELACKELGGRRM